MAESSHPTRLTTRGISSLRADGFTDETIGRLIAVRIRYQRGEYSDETEESRRLLFARWLYEHGRIGEGQADDAEVASSPIGEGEE